MTVEYFLVVFDVGFPCGACTLVARTLQLLRAANGMVRPCSRPTGIAGWLREVSSTKEHAHAQVFA